MPRFDLYTANDRASEARAAYREDQQYKFALWVILGGLSTGLFVSIAIYHLLNYLKGDSYYTTGPFIGVWVVATILLIILGASIIQIVAFYQGIVIGAISGAIAFGVIWILLQLFGVPDGAQTWVPRIISVVVAVPTLIAGILGSFLPDV